MKKITVNVLLIIATIVTVVAGYMAYQNKKPNHLLPYIGEEVNGMHHQVPEFQFIDQEGAAVSQVNFANKIYVTEFFFATCQSICPIMNDNMKKLYGVYKGENRIKFLSHTVKPEEDTIQALKVYAKTLGINDNFKWHFVTGNKKELYEIARKGYLVNNEEGSGDADDFIHTQFFVLVDWNRNLRGFYDGTKDEDIEKLKIDIKLLLEEMEYNS